MGNSDQTGLRAQERTEADDAHDLRCICRNLVARRRGQGIELKCRRCRRVLLLEFGSRGRIEVSVLEY